MTTKEIRDELMMQRATYNNAKIAMDRACEQIKVICDEISEEDIALIESKGISIRDVLSMDLERCKVDQNYFNNVKNKMEDTVQKLHSFLEGELNA